jgi:hypothetical protein
MLKICDMKTDRYTTEQVITAIKETKGMLTIAAERLKCHPETVRTYVNRYPTVKAALQEQREGVLDVAELALMRAVQNGESWAVTFCLATIGRQRGYIKKEEIEHSGSIDVKKLSDDELEQIARG